MTKWDLISDKERNMSNCRYYECNKNDKDRLLGLSFPILCPDCGNKRCPHATDHRLACTNSNERGQMGSRYGVYPHPGKPLLDFLEGKKNDSTS